MQGKDNFFSERRTLPGVALHFFVFFRDSPDCEWAPSIEELFFTICFALWPFSCGGLSRLRWHPVTRDRCSRSVWWSRLIEEQTSKRHDADLKVEKWKWWFYSSASLSVIFLFSFLFCSLLFLFLLASSFVASFSGSYNPDHGFATFSDLQP